MSFFINPFIYAVGGCSGSIISTTNIQAYYNVNGNFDDASGQNNSAPTNITYTSSGKYSSGATFNGTTAYATMPTKDYSASTAYSISAWIKTTGITEQHILTRDKVNMTPSTDNRRCWQFRIDATTGVLRVVRFSNNTTVVSNFASTAAVNTGSWVHVAMVFDNTVGSKIYINGVQDGSDVVTTNNNNVADSSPTIGIQQGNTAGAPLYFFNGTMDEVSFFNRALTGAEISTIAASSCPLNSSCPVNLIDSTSLMLYYKFNSDTFDSSGNGDNLSMSGTATYATGKFGNAIDLSGTNNFGYLPNSAYSVSGVGDVSWGAWVRSDTSASTHVVMSKYANNSGYGLGLDVGTFYTFFNANTTYYEINSGAGTAQAGVWNHIVATRKASTGQFFVYRNGAYVTSASTNTNTMTDVTEDYRLGAQKIVATVTRFWDGLVDEAFVYHRVLTASEISTIYGSTCPLKT